MKLKIGILFLTVFTMIAVNSGFGGPSALSKIKEDKVTYTVGNNTFNGVIVYDENLKGKRPAILVVHEWWGFDEYSVKRARQLAELGYIAMAVDMYGAGKLATNPTEAKELATPFYKDPSLGKVNLDAALAKLKSYGQCNAHEVFAIGYCFGGSVVLNSAKLGADLLGVVSFHGGLAGVPANKALLKAKILVCHGVNDKFVSESDISGFKQQLDSIGASYKFIVYSNATHAFTNPGSTATGKKFNLPIEYNQKADEDSWNDMKMFFAKVLKK